MPTHRSVGLLAQYTVSSPVEHGQRESPENTISHFVHKVFATLCALLQTVVIKPFTMMVQLTARLLFSVFFWLFLNPFVFVRLPQEAFLSSSTMRRLVLTLFNAAIKLGAIYTSICILAEVMYFPTSGVDVNQALLTVLKHVPMVGLEKLSGHGLVLAHPDPLHVFDEDTWAKKFDRKFPDLLKDIKTWHSTLIFGGLVVASSAGKYFRSQPSKEMGDGHFGLFFTSVLLVVFIFLEHFFLMHSTNEVRSRVLGRRD
ncbi:hypothetical protein AN958_06433 [Leucoagaricus sp. SymC.cos]|nr:hypothetical protein AN958_06433 [Leucoagaricus sp. SymC.cos]